ncbi:hypothetical protein PVIIG_02475 [Plasmodium vivax India VII]|uniref:Amine oxidase domain-containing protein n=1 Tax=Plasmodium vivax India VII TaxID=1077284 RepID=A0A0J9SI51_PLAVI|nr:hypothetical protein PVIIG_02475 [Plasmodium vivax India VII]
MSLLKDSELEEVHRKIIDGTIEKCGQFYNTRILEAIKIRWLKIYERKLQATEKGPDEPGAAQQGGAPNVADDFEDDEFEDAEVEEKEIAELEQHLQDDEADELNELDDISISDLSDVDPPTSNVIVGICDKITKPCGRRNASSNWKIKLKGGLMKVDGKEMFFRSLQGDLDIVGGGVDSLCLALYLSKNKHHIKLLNVKRKCSLLDSHYSKKNVCEVGRHYAFPLSGSSSHFGELLRWVTAEDEVIRSNPYASNLSYLDECGRTYRVNKFIFRILFCLLKDHLFGASIPNPKEERMSSFIRRRFDANLLESVISPYCLHYFGYSPRDVLMRSHFPEFMDRLEEEKSLVKALRATAKKGSSSIFAQKKKSVKFAKGNVTLLSKLRDHLELCSNVEVRLGRKSIKCEQIIFCLSPPELKGLLRKVIFEGKQMDALVKEDTLVKKYLSKFRSHAVRISNVCFAKNVLPLSHSLESLLLFKRNKQNKLISLLYDGNIFPPQCDGPSGVEDHPGEPSPEGGLYETSLRFMSRETDERKSVEEIDRFLRGVLGVQEKPDLLVSHVHHVFPFDARADQAYKKIIRRKCPRVRLFWTFYFFRSFEFCLQEAKRFGEAV